MGSLTKLGGALLCAQKTLREIQMAHFTPSLVRQEGRAHTDTKEDIMIQLGPAPSWFSGGGDGGGSIKQVEC